MLSFLNFTIHAVHDSVATSPLSGGFALNVWFTTNGMCVKNNTVYMWREQAMIERLRRMISTVAYCCHSAKLCAHASRVFPIATIANMFPTPGSNHCLPQTVGFCSAPDPCLHHFCESHTAEIVLLSAVQRRTDSSCFAIFKSSIPYLSENVSLNFEMMF